MSPGDDTSTPHRDLTATGDFTGSVLSRGAIVSGTYRILRKIGAGGMGVVYEAEHLRLAELRLAIKVLTPEVSRHEETMARFRREAEICTRLQHPNIVRVSDFNVLDDGTPFLVMEHLKGESLTIRMARGSVPREEAFSILRQIGEALDAAHRQGIVHRDLKPGNVFLHQTDPGAGSSQPPTVKILDFGISKVLDEGTLCSDPDSRIMGSPRYMSPEQAEGRNREVGPPSDQFSLAAMAVELLTGKTAFPGNSPSGILYQVVHEEADGLEVLDRDFAPEVGQAVRRALAKDPGQRFPSVADLLNAMDRGSLFPDRPGRSLLRPARSSPGWRAAFAALVLIALSGAGAYLLLEDRIGTEPEPSTAAVPTPVTTAAPPPPEPSTAVDAGTGNQQEDKEQELEQKARHLAERARTLYDQQQFRETIRLARQSLDLKPTGDALVLLTLSHCALGEAEQARPWLGKVPAERRASTMIQCRHLGSELEESPGAPAKNTSRD